MRITRYLPIALTVAVLIAVTGPAAADRAAEHWTSLGELHVKDRVERDTLKVGIRKGSFDKIRLKVTGRAVQFRSVKIHFENDTVQDVSLRSVIRAGRFSRAIDLEGGQRVIEKVVLVYDAQTRRRGQGARVEVYGRR